MTWVVVRVDVTQLDGWARRLLAARAAAQAELRSATDELTATGAGIARGLVRVDSGRLQGSIQPEPATFAGDVATGSYAPDTEYAAIHEFGGTIVPRRGRYLRFIGRGGGPVFVRRVVITAQPYMRPSAVALRALVRPAYGAAMRRVWSGLFGEAG
jgi:phage gpG-like protein